MSADLLPYNRHVNYSKSSNTLFSTSTDVPKAWNEGRNFCSFLRSFRGVTFPFRMNALVVSQPVNACRAACEGKIDINSEISCNCMDIQETSLVTRRLFTSLHKNLFQSRGTLVDDGPFTRCALAEPLRDRSTPSIERG